MSPLTQSLSKFVILSFLLIPLHPLLALHYFLNPENLPTDALPPYTRLEPSDQAEWLKGFYRSVDLRIPQQEDLLRKFQTQYQKATQDLIEMKPEESMKAADEGLRILSRSFPYPQMPDDLERLIAVKAMAFAMRHEGEDVAVWASDIPREATPFINTAALKRDLPVRIQKQIASFGSRSISLEASHLSGPKPTQVFISGKAVELPQSIPFGRSLVHALQNASLKIYWIDLSDQGLKAELIDEQEIWTSIPLAQLRAPLSISRPKNLPAGSISVLVKSSNGRIQPLLLTPEESRTQIQKESLSPEKLGKDFARPSNLERDLMQLEANQESQDETIFENPWFWVGVGAVVAGVTGYLVYDNTRPRKVNLP